MQAKIVQQIDTKSILGKVDKSLKICRKRLKSEIVKDSAKYTPMRTGVLKQSVIPSSTIDDKYLIWNTPYARYLYHGQLMVDPKTGSPYARFGVKKVLKRPGVKLKYYKGANAAANSFWVRRAKEANITKWIDIYKKGVKI